MANAMTPDQVDLAWKQKLEPEVDQAIEVVNNFLVNLRGDRVCLSSREISQNDAVNEIVAERFRLAGWTVRKQSDQREGDWYEFIR